MEMSRRIVSRTIFSLSLIASLWLSGCASTSTFTAYPSKMNPLLRTLQTRKPIDFSQCLLSECKSNDAILYEMERGRFAQIQGNVDVSMQDFAAAIERIKANDDKAIISASDIGANLAATAVNDNAIPYRGAGYERVMLHHYQALNYLAKKDLEGAGVEIRIANAEQEEALKRHESEVEKAQETATSKSMTGALENPRLSKVYAQMDEVAGKVKNSFQNAYTFYLSGFIYEAMQQPNDAYIDYKKALEIHPDNSYLQKDVVRLARDLSMADDLEAFKSRFGIEPPSAATTTGDLLVLFEDGFVPQKQQVKVPLPIRNFGLQSVAFPIYRERWTPPRGVTVATDGEEIGATEPICDFRVLSVKALKEEVPVIATRQVIRLASKAATAREMKQRLGAFGELGMSIWNGLSENADLRSWISLPADAQVLRVTLPAGSHKLTLKDSGRAAATVDLNISEGSRTILHVVRAGQEFYTAVMPLSQGKPVQQEASTSKEKL